MPKLPLISVVMNFALVSVYFRNEFQKLIVLSPYISFLCGMLFNDFDILPSVGEEGGYKLF